ncbi:MAG: regulatory protein RecX [Magnetococcales bacterium]|nr:regulatory protein RecX [Magnetococcales bacterium]
MVNKGDRRGGPSKKSLSERSGAKPRLPLSQSDDQPEWTSTPLDQPDSNFDPTDAPDSKSIEPDYRPVYDQAVRLLSRRPHGEAELRQKLLRSQRDPQAIQLAIHRCRELGYLDDRAYAQSLVRNRLGMKGWGPQKIRAELRHKGVEENLSREVVADLLGEADLVELARKALIKRFGSGPKLAHQGDWSQPEETVAGFDGEEAKEWQEEGVGMDDPRKSYAAKARQRKKRYDFLARRGFDPETIRRALE